MSTCGQAAGGGAVLDEFRRRLPDGCLLVEAGCRGLCFAEPLVEIYRPSFPRLVYERVTPAEVPRLVEGLVTGVFPSDGLLGICYVDSHALVGRTHALAAGAERGLDELPFLKGQRRLVLSECGLVDPASLREYAAVGGYAGLAAALSAGKPQEVIDAVEASGLRGRGGAGFPTGQKWRLAAQEQSDERYFIVNADEGDPGAYMDRTLMESSPYRVLEGLALGAYAIGAHTAYVFIRAEYPRAIESMRYAIDVARQENLLGRDILGSGYGLDVSIVTSAGAYVCGEETSMLSVLENRGYRPRKRPPYPVEKGLWGKPTVINNVETLANVPVAISRGPETLSGIGSSGNAGTKVFSLTGSVPRNGLIEVKLGTTLGTIIGEIGGGHDAVAAQIGGPSGMLIPLEGGDRPIDFDSLASLGGIMGSGGIVVLGPDQCVVDTVRYFMHFSAGESCGRCRSCKDGLREAADLLDGIVDGRGRPEDIEALEKLVDWIPKGSLCGLGRSAMRPLQSALRFFRQDFIEHIEGSCHALVCKGLIRLEIDKRRCQGERCCLQTCPGNAIKGRFGKPGYIDQRLCIKCKTCIQVCPYGAIQVISEPRNVR